MLGDKIKKYRIDNNLTQEEFAAKLFVTRNAVSKWENDNGYPNSSSIVIFNNLAISLIVSILG